MNNVGRIPPALVDAKILRRIANNTNTQHIVSKSLFMTEFEKICTSLLMFLKNYWLYIVTLSLIIGYIWYCYIEHQEKKKNMLIHMDNAPQVEHYAQGEYVCDNDQVRILQRPIPEYKHNDVNRKIRTMYLEELNPPPIRVPIPRPCPVNHRLHKSRDLPKLQRGLPANIYETKIGSMDYRKTTYPSHPSHLPMPRKLPTVNDRHHSCHKQEQRENKIETKYGQPMGPMMPISQCPGNPLDEYGDTFYDAPIHRPCNDDSDEFDDQFYDNTCY
jgi:hypothetical protein